MHCNTRKLLIALALLSPGGCEPKREVVGETLPDAGTSGAATSEPTTDVVVTTDDPTTGAPDGAPCELAPGELVEDSAMNEPTAAGIEYGGGPMVSRSPTCAGEVCLYGADFDPPNCDSDAPCAGDERLTGSCGEFQCDIVPAWGEAHTTCTRTCEADDDCPALPGCAQGPVCTAIDRLGSLCCQKLCACRDELNEDYLDEVRSQCESGMFCQ